MKKFLKIINKYIVLLIVLSIFKFPWTVISSLYRESLHDTGTYGMRASDSIPVAAALVIKLIIIGLLIIDAKNEKVKPIVLACVASLFYPLLGVVIFAILLTIKMNEEKSAPE